MFLPVDGGIGPVPGRGPAVRPHSRQRTDNVSQNKKLYSIHCKKGYRFSRPQPGCHLPNSQVYNVQHSVHYNGK